MCTKISMCLMYTKISICLMFSSFSTMHDVHDVGIVSNMLRALKYLFALCTRKYQFALCFRVLSNLYVKRSAYANVFKFNRERKHFERAKVNSRCFHWFPAAMFILNTIIFRRLCDWGYNYPP